MSKQKENTERSVSKAKRAHPLAEAVEDIEDALSFSKDETRKLRVSLLDWYDLNRRELPWRTQHLEQEKEEEVERRAYGVWVSEVMLQQTRVQTVIAYYNRWMQKWPTIHHLAQASLETNCISPCDCCHFVQEVNEMWAGLGYYRRARFLLEGAKKIAAEGGKIPNVASMLRKIPGIGDYTSGAIASIAFKEVVPVVDGNVVRVIARLRAVSANPKDSVTVKRFWCTTWLKTLSRKVFLLTTFQPKRELERRRETSLVNQICYIMLTTFCN
uniref:A/G-specific adenine DNA glycosylase n=1 Tax=Cajanus cajan TaxID=3821 RepID=A0A151SSD1_CAJCA|nr:A/G-specific adenine DNA glycosylase [Cajanus cajan]